MDTVVRKKSFLGNKSKRRKRKKDIWELHDDL